MRIIALRYVVEKAMGQCTFGGVATGRKKFSTDLNAKSPFLYPTFFASLLELLRPSFFLTLTPQHYDTLLPAQPPTRFTLRTKPKNSIQTQYFSPPTIYIFFFSFMFIHSPAHTPFELCHAVCLVVSFFSSLTRRHRRLPKVDQRIHPPHRGSALKEGQLSCRHL